MAARDPQSVPDVIVAHALNDYFEVMTRAVFQAGVAWKQIASHWDAYHEAFARFDPAVVSRYDGLDIERILETPGILRMPKKIRATVANAGALLAADREFGGFASYLRAFDSYAALAKDIKKRFALIGDMSAWYFLFRVGEPVPRFEPWVATIPGDHPRMREMVDKAREDGRSPEVDA